MKAFACITLVAVLFVVVASTSAAETPAPLPRGWVDLFAPPYAECPTILMAISCVSDSVCFCPGGDNGVGFDVMKFDGQRNGRFVGLDMPDAEMMMMAISVGGTATDPKGAVGGMSFMDSIQYFVNDTTLLPSSQPLLVVTQDIRSSDDGQHVIVIDNGGTGAGLILYSSNAGKNFTSRNITSLMPTPEAFARYGAVAAPSVWYITLGSWPDNSQQRSTRNKDGSSTHQLTERITMTSDKNKGVKRTVKNTFAERAAKKQTADKKKVGNTGYTAVIAKTTDAGKTWNNVFYDATDFYLNGIDCVNETKCIAVGEGFDEHAGGHILRLTDDGNFFEKVAFYPSNSSGDFSFMSVAYNPKNPLEAWVGGSFSSQEHMMGLFLYTQDGGKTWAEHGSLDFIGDITSMSFTQDGVAFATAITMFDDSTVLRYDSTGPAPTPSPTWNGNFTQVQCDDQHCKVNCTAMSLPQMTCLKLNGGGSAMAQCTEGMLMQHIYPLDDKCTGPSEEQPQPINQCLVAENGSFENFCGPKAYEFDMSKMKYDGLLMKKQI